MDIGFPDKSRALHPADLAYVIEVIADDCLPRMSSLIRLHYRVRGSHYLFRWLFFEKHMRAEVFKLIEELGEAGVALVVVCNSGYPVGPDAKGNPDDEGLLPGFDGFLGAQPAVYEYSDMLYLLRVGNLHLDGDEALTGCD